MSCLLCAPLAWEGGKLCCWWSQDGRGKATDGQPVMEQRKAGFKQMVASDLCTIAEYLIHSL